MHARTIANYFSHYSTLTFASPSDLEPSVVSIRLFHQTPSAHASPAIQQLPSPRSQQHSPEPTVGRRPSVPDASTTPEPASDTRARSATPTRGLFGVPSLSTQAPVTAAPTHTDFTASHASASSGYPAHLGHPAGASAQAAPHPLSEVTSIPITSPPPAARDISQSQSSLLGPPASPPIFPSSPGSGPGLLDSAAAAMLVASPSDSSIVLSAQEVPVDVAEEEQSVRRAPAPAAAEDASATDRSMSNIEGRTEALHVADGEAHAAGAAAGSPPKTVDQEAEDRRLVEEELERRRAEEEDAQRRAAEEEKELRAQEEERLRLEAEAERVRQEEERRLAEEARLTEEERRAEEQRLAEEAEKLRLEEEEQTRRAEEEMRLLIERQRLEKQLREEEEARQREQARQREVEERRRQLVQARDSDGVMLSGTVNVQGGGSMVRELSYLSSCNWLMTAASQRSYGNDASSRSADLASSCSRARRCVPIFALSIGFD